MNWHYNLIYMVACGEQHACCLKTSTTKGTVGFFYSQINNNFLQPRLASVQKVGLFFVMKEKVVFTNVKIFQFEFSRFLIAIYKNEVSWGDILSMSQWIECRRRRSTHVKRD